MQARDEIERTVGEGAGGAGGGGQRRPPVAVAGLVAESLLLLGLDAGRAESPPGPGAAARVLARLGNYDLLEQLGRGGMGVVYRARQRSLDREVAVKVITSGAFADDGVRRRFRREAATAAQLDHPNIVRVYETGEDHGQPFFSMEFVDGQTLAHRLAEGPLPWREACRVVAEVARAVAFAHHRGILHRDLKPGNVLLDAEGRVKITDFGLSARLDGTSALTVTGEFLGTPDFMPLEQILGDKAKIGVRSDIYALGAILYCALTGHRPYPTGTTVELADRQRAGAITPPREFDRRISRDLETVCLKCLESDPRARYAGAGELADELSRVVADRPVVARQITGPQRFVRWCRRNPLAAATMVLLVVAAGAMAVAWVAADTARREAERRRAEAERASYFATINLAASRMGQGSFDQARELLAGAPAGLRNWEWGRLFAVCDSAATLFEGHGKAVVAGAMTGDGARLATAGYDRTVRIWNLQTARPGPVIELPIAVHALSWAADGQRLAMAPDSGGIEIRAVGGAHPEQQFFPGASSVQALVWLPGMERIACGGNDGSVRIWDMELGGDTILHRAGEDVAALAVTHDGRTLAAGYRDGSCRLFDLRQQTAGRKLAVGAAAVQSLAFAAAGDLIAVGAWDGTATVVRVADGKTVATAVHDGPVSAVAFTPDGKRLVTGSLDWGVRVIDLPSGSISRVSHSHSDFVTYVGVTPDGLSVASASYDQTVRIAPLLLENRRLDLVGHQGAIRGAGFLRDGRRLATASEDGAVVLWDANTGRELGRFATGGLTAFAVSPVADLIATGHATGEIRLWRPFARGEDRVITAHGDQVWSLGFSPDGSRLVSTSRDGSLRVWSMPEGRPAGPDMPIGPDSADPPCAAVFSPDGTRLAVAQWNGRITVVAVGAGRATHSIHERGRARALSFTPDGRLLAVATDDSVVHLYDTATGTAAGGLSGHSQAVRSAVMFADGSRVLTGGGDGTVRVWDLAQQRELLALAEGGDGVEAVAYSPALRSVVTGHRSGRLHVWFAEDWSRPAETLYAQRLRDDRVRRLATQLYAQLGGQTAYGPADSSELPGRSELVYYAPRGPEPGQPTPLPATFSLYLRNDFAERLTGVLAVAAAADQPGRATETAIAIPPGGGQEIEIPLPPVATAEEAEELEHPPVAVWNLAVGDTPVWSRVSMPVLVDVWPYRRDEQRLREAFRMRANLAVVPVPGKKVAVDIARVNPFPWKTTESLRWQIPANDRWQISPVAATLDLVPSGAAAARFEILFRGGHAEVFPLPELESRVTTDGTPVLTQRVPLPVDWVDFFKGYRPQARARRAAVAAVIDGKLDDPVWQVPPIKEPLLRSDGTGPAAQATEARFAVQGGTLLVGLRMIEPLAAQVASEVGERDRFSQGHDSVEVFLGSANRKDYVQFAFFPGRRAGDAPPIYDLRTGDPRWNLDFPYKTGRESGAWTVEAAIPLDRLGLGINPARGGALGLQLVRTRVTGDWEKSNWRPNFGNHHQPWAWGVLNLDPGP